MDANSDDSVVPQARAGACPDRAASPACAFARYVPQVDAIHPLATPKAERPRAFSTEVAIKQWLDPWYLTRARLRARLAQHTPKLEEPLLDVGCGNRPYEDLVARLRRVALDVPPAPRADVHASACRLPFGDATFASVLCTEVVEHIAEPREAFLEIHRVLRDGGLLLLSCPQTWGLHDEPHDYYRFTRYGLAHLATTSGFEVVALERTSGFFVTWAQRATDVLMVELHIEKRNRAIRACGKAMSAGVLLAGALGERAVGARGDTLDHVLLARKAS